MPQNAVTDALLQFERVYELEDNGNAKTLVVRCMSNRWIEPAADLLTESFADSMGYLDVYKNFLRKQIEQYLRKHVLLLPKTAILVAVLTDKANTQGEPTEELESNVEFDSQPKSEFLVGTVEVSFSQSTRSPNLTLNPPPELPYLCNMAVDPSSRGQGYGSLLLDAAEDLILEVGYKSLFLHVRHADPPALSLYRKFGFSEEGEDWPLVKLLGMDRRYLMKKSLVYKSQLK